MPPYLMFRDATGKLIAFRSPPRCIVTLTPALAEQVFALGLGRRVVGVTIRSEHPPRAARKPRVGNLYYPDVSKIAALRPDLILAARELNRRETVEALRARGLRVFVVPACSSCAQVLASFRRLGRMLGCEAKASRLLARVARELSRPRGREHPRVFLQVWSAPLMGIGRASYLHDLLERCGGGNILADRPGRVVVCSEKEVVRANPEVILITLKRAAPEMRRWWQHPQLAAVQLRRIHTIPAHSVMPSPMALVRGARQLRKLLQRRWVK